MLQGEGHCQAPFGTPRTKIATMDVLSLSLGSTGLLTAVFVFLSVIYYIFSKKTQENNAPPSCKGWIPWLGCAFDFGVAPLGFIDKKRREVCKL